MLVKWIIIGFIVDAITTWSMLEFGVDLKLNYGPVKAKERAKTINGIFWLVYVLTRLFFDILGTVVAAILWPYAIFSFIANVIFKKGIDKEG